MSRLTLALDQIALVRDYTNDLLKDVAESDWYKIPSGGVSHIAWQVGHIAMAQYRLALERLRARTSEDAILISDDFLSRFGRASVPETDLKKAIPVSEIRAVFDGVYRAVLGELSVLPETDLDSPVLKPHKLVKTKIWALLYSAQHEMLHAGQIGLLRRELGHAPMW
jgi:DinB superfamily